MNIKDCLYPYVYGYARAFRRSAFYINMRNRKWRKQNKANFTYIEDDFDFSKVEVGDYTYGYLNVQGYGPNDGRLKIGKFCSIAYRVRFILGGEHSLNTISTYPFEYYFDGMESGASAKGDIVIDSDVWIGDSVCVLSGSHIGQGAVIAAGAVVVGTIPPYAIAGGVPAKVIRYRFDDDTIKELLKIDYERIDKNFVNVHRDLFEANMMDENFEKEKLDIIPKRS